MFWSRRRSSLLILPFFLLLLARIYAVEDESKSLEIVVYLTLLGRSHLDFAAALINKLAERGHAVDLIVAQLNPYVTIKVPAARRTIAIPFPGSTWGSQAHLQQPFDVLPYEHDVIRTSMRHFHAIYERLCEHMLESAALAGHLSSNKYDMALVSAYDACPLGIAHHYNISRVASFSAMPASISLSFFSGTPAPPVYRMDTTNTHNGAAPSSFMTRMQNLLRAVHLEVEIAPAYVEHSDAIFRRAYGASFPSVLELSRRLSYEFVNSHPLLESPRPFSAARHRYIGGVSVRRHRPVEDKKYTDLLSARPGGVVLVSFGSQIPAAAFPPRVLEAFVASFARFPSHTFIWRFDAGDDKEAAPKLAGLSDNVHLVDWLPQNDLLNDDRVAGFISHTGLNSFMEATHAGVPLICVPLFADQYHNCESAVFLGVGLRLQKTTFNEEQLTNSLQKILAGNSSFRARSREVARMLRAQPATPSRIFVDTVEFAAKFDNLHHNTLLAGSSFPFYQHYGYDVVIVLFSLFLLTLLSFSILAYIIVRCAFRGCLAAKTRCSYDALRKLE